MNGIERAGNYILDNWPAMMQQFYLAWQYGVALFKGALAIMITRMVAGRAMMMAGSAMAATAVGGGALRKFADMVMTAGRWGGKHGRKHQRPDVGGMPANMHSLSAFLLNTFRPFLTSLTAMTGIIVPLVAIVTALGVAFTGVGIILAGMAVYVVSQWKQITQSIRTALDEGTLSMRPLIEGMYRMWETLKAVGKIALGEGSATDILQRMISEVGIMFVWLAQKIAPLLDLFATGVEFFGLGSKLMEREATIQRQFGLISDEEAYEHLSAAQRNREMVDKIRRMAEAARNASTKPFDEIDQAFLDLKGLEWDKKIGDFFGGADAPKGTNVNIQNVIVNQDLRGMDPDNVFASFLPQLERLANQRTTAFGQAPQGA